MKLVNTSIEFIFYDIEKGDNYKVIYEKRLLNRDKPINDQGLEVGFINIFKHTGIDDNWEIEKSVDYRGQSVTEIHAKEVLEYFLNQ